MQQTKTRVKAVVVAVALVFGVVAAASVAGAPPASAQTLAITSLTMTLTRSPHVITITDDGIDCTIVTPTTNCGADWFGGFFANVSLLLNLALYALDLHFAVNSMVMHLPDASNPNCLFNLPGARLLNLNAAELFALLAVLGTYTVTGCGILVQALFMLIFGASPSTTHLNLHVTTAHV